MNPVAQAQILAILALRNLWSHKVKSGIVGAIMMFGTFLVVFGSAILDSVEGSMEKSITSSMAGDAQIYSADAKDDLALFGGAGFGSSDIGEIDDFPKVHDALLTIDNVKDVVPMGITIATVFGGNDIDRALTDLRDAVNRGDEPARIDKLGQRVRRIADNVAAAYGVAADIQRDKDKVAQDREALARATSDAFWQTEFPADPSGSLDFLEGRIAPLAADARNLYFRTVGTNLAQFQATFDRMRVVDGQMVPPGKRGFLMSKRTYEKLVKNLVARDLDDIKEDWDKGTRLATDTLLAERVERNSRQYQRILFQLDPDQQARLEPLLAAEVHGKEGDLAALIQTFLKVDDTNIEERYAFFYKEIAPNIRLYDIKVGDVITLRAYTKSGYARSVNVRVYGTYEFAGLEKSDLAGAADLTDLVTWRELYGKMSPEQLAELSSISTSVGVKDVSRDNAEDALFGGGGSIEAVAAPSTGFDGVADLNLGSLETRQAAIDEQVYTEAEFESGLALNAAVILKDPSKIAATMRDIEAKSKADGLNIKVVTWQQASGMIGQFITVMRAVLYSAIFVIFIVALVIINNSMVMATMERTPEIGTMRAIGAQRPFVAILFIVETMVLGILAGGAGALGAALAVIALGKFGIPAPNDILVFLFGGPRLFPGVLPMNLVFGVTAILIVSVLSTLYPALLAAWVQPVVAMRGKE